MKNRSIALVIAILMIATLLTPMCFADEHELPAPDMEVSKDIAPDASAPAEIVNDMVLTIGATDAEASDDTSSDKEDAPKMIFEPANFVKNLYYMGLGMLGIFVVIGVIILATALLNKTFQSQKDE